jgi:chromate transporter
LWAIYLVSALATIITETENVALFFVGGVLVWLVKAPPAFLRVKPTLNGLVGLPLLGFANSSYAPKTDADMLLQIAVFFSQAGAFVFGSGLAIVPFLYGGVVKDYQWLSETQFVDAVAVAMITPGPVVITVGFIGYLVAGLPGAVVASTATFLPCYLFTILPAPYFKKYGKRPDIAAFVEGVTVGAVGAISGAVVVLGQRAIYDIPTAGIALGTLLILWNSKRASEPILIAACAVLGMLLYPLV